MTLGPLAIIASGSALPAGRWIVADYSMPGAEMRVLG